MIRLEKFHVAVFALLMEGRSVFLPLVAEAREIPWLLRIKAQLPITKRWQRPLGMHTTSSRAIILKTAVTGSLARSCFESLSTNGVSKLSPVG